MKQRQHRPIAGQAKKPAPDRDRAVFEAWVTRNDDCCWLWSGPRTGDGYGRIQTHSFGRVRAHRFSLYLATGEMPVGKYACHKCDNPLCVRPDHLYWGDAVTNGKDAAARGRARVPGKVRLGVCNKKAKLRPDLVLELVAAYQKGLGLSALGRRYGVSPQSIYAVVNGHAWAHVTGLTGNARKVAA